MSTSTAIKPRLFITGASGYIGSVITEFAIAEGYEVYGLSRSDTSDAKLTSLGAVPIRGDLSSFDVLHRESNNAQCDYQEVIRINAAAVDAIGKGLQGTKSKLIVTSGTLVVEPDPNGVETMELSPPSKEPLNGRIRSEQYALELGKNGVDVCSILLAPFVYGRGGSGIKLFMQMASRNGESTYIDDREVCTSAIHVDDAARLYLLAVKKAKANEIYNATSSTNVTMRQIAEAMGSIMNLPVRSLTLDEAVSKAGKFLANFLRAENRASSAKAIRELEWHPREVGLLDDIIEGSYQGVAKALSKGGA